MENPDTYQALFWGYSVVWLLIASYVLVLRKKINNIEKQINKEQAHDLES